MAKTSAPVSRGAPQGRSLGRYLVFGEIASGGTATVHIGRRRGPAGNGQMVAIKRLHTHLLDDPRFTSMLMAEARLTSRVRHPNVVPLVEVLDAGDGELLLVMDYVHGETLGSLLGIARRRGRAIAPGIAVAIIKDMLLGLHAAHEAQSEEGAPLSLVHGDVSPQNIIVGADGKARLLDFGIARATAPEGGAPGELDAKGALAEPRPEAGGRRMMGTPAYMAPERWQQGPREGGDRRADLFSAGVVFWEMLVLDRLFRGEGESQGRPSRPIPPPSRLNPAVPTALDAVVQRALQARPEDRFATALDFLTAATTACPPASAEEVAAWIAGLCGQRLRERAADLARIEAVASAEFVATDIVDDGPTVVEADLAARLARLVERENRSPLPRPWRPTLPAFEDADTQCLPARQAVAFRGPSGPLDCELTLGEETPALTPTVIPSGRHTPSRTMPLPLAAPLPVASEPAGPAPTLTQAAHPSLHLTAQTQPLDAGFTASDPGDSAAEGGRLPDFYRREGRRSYAVLPALPERPSPPRARGRVLLFMASLPSVALVLVLLGRTQPQHRAEAAPALATPDPRPAVALARTAPSRAAPAPTPPEPAAAVPPEPAAVPPEPVTAEVLTEMAAPTRQSPPRRARAAAPRSASAESPPADWTTASAINELHRRALTAYDDLDPETALSLLQRGLRRCQDRCERQPHLLALTHLHLGVVLAGGFKQPGLAAKHFRIARTLDPLLAPAERLLAPEVRAALRASRPAAGL